jgi:hypothetical protein
MKILFRDASYDVRHNECKAGIDRKNDFGNEKLTSTLVFKPVSQKNAVLIFLTTRN